MSTVQHGEMSTGFNTALGSQYGTRESVRQWDVSTAVRCQRSWCPSPSVLEPWPSIVPVSPTKPGRMALRYLRAWGYTCPF